MTLRSYELFERRITPTSAARWVFVLVASVFILVVLLLRRTESPIDSDVTEEIARKLNVEASKNRWTAARARDWYSAQPWFIGANYIPSTAVNVLEMWQKETFDAQTIERELHWASQRFKMNSLRVFLHALLWMDNSTEFFERIEIFLSIADKNKIKVMFVLFDECWKPDPQLGKQPEPINGVHNSQWVRCPGQKMLMDRSFWPTMGRYTIEVINRFKSDNRVFAWDLYNEPECSKQIKVVLPFLRYIYSSARLVDNVEQPMTIGIGRWPLTTPLAQFELSVSDIISFHSYGSLSNLMKNITDLRDLQLDRPILCTEWLARPFGSTIFTHLEYFQSEKIGAIHWGLVAGRSQTYYQWRSPEGAPMPKIWFHDVLHQNGTAFNSFEEQFYVLVSTKQNQQTINAFR